jgi:serine/threonine-protein kinase
MSRPAPARIGRYEIEGELGRGAMGVVYAARDPLLGRALALKAIEVAGAQGEEARGAFEERFLREARIAARLAHPGIVVVHDVGRDDDTGLLFMALERLPGRPLDQVIRERAPFEWREAASLAARVARALDHAHRSGVVHRDVKPANVMLLPSGEPKLMDFGVARLDSSRLTVAGQAFGTPLYMSPEQALGHEVDARSDLFSLGAVLYEMLTGRRAFAGPSLPAIVQNVLAAQPEPLSRARPGLPADLEAVAARALAREPAERHPTGTALAEDLEDVVAGRPPRHGAGWDVPQEAVRTQVRAAPSAPAPVPPAVSPPPSRPAEPAPPPKAAPASRRRWLAAGALAVIAAGALTLWPGAFGLGSSEVAVDFEHSLREGTLRVFVDGRLTIDEEFDGRVDRQVLGVTTYKGSWNGALTLPAGKREVAVEVLWEEGSQRRETTVELEAGEPRRLRIRFGSLGGLRRSLSLEWRAGAPR